MLADVTTICLCFVNGIYCHCLIINCSIRLQSFDSSNLHTLMKKKIVGWKNVPMYDIRNNTDLYIHRNSIPQSQKFLKYRAIKANNSISTYIRTNGSLGTFKRYLKLHLFELVLYVQKFWKSNVVYLWNIRCQLSAIHRCHFKDVSIPIIFFFHVHKATFPVT